MKSNEELILIWDNLHPQEKMAFGDQWISHETNLRAWDKPFSELSPLKRKRVLMSVEVFSHIKIHPMLGSGIDSSTLEKNKFKDGVRILSDSELFNAMKKDLKITNIDIAEIIGLTPDSVKNQTQPNKDLPTWAKSMIFVWKNKKGELSPALKGVNPSE